MPINPDYTYGNNFQELEPYMLYGDRSAAGRSLERKDSIVQDLEYLQGMYPGHMKRLQEYVVSACDHLDYKNSPMYDEFPDRMMIHQICDSICSQIRNDGILTDEITEGSEYADSTAVEEEPAEEMEWGAQEMEWRAEAAEEPDLLSQDRSSWDPPPWGPEDAREFRDPREYRGPREYREPREYRDFREYRDPREYRDFRDPGRPFSRRIRDGLLDGVVNVLLLNEIHRRRCRSGFCR